MYFFHYFHVTKKKGYINEFKKDPWKTWVKISKVMPHPNSPFPWEREGSLTAKSPNLCLTVHIHFFILVIYKQNFSNLRFVFWQNFQRIIQIPRNLPQKPTNNAKFAPFIHYTLYFQMPDHHRELSEIPVNQVKFAPFTHKSHESCEICTIYHPHLVHYFQISDHRQRTPGNWSKSTRFCAVCPQLLRITWNSLNPQPTVPAI